MVSEHIAPVHLDVPLKASETIFSHVYIKL